MPQNKNPVPPEDLPAILDSLYAHFLTLHSHSPPSDLSKLGAFFTPSTTATLRSMREPLSTGREAFLADVKDSLQSTRLLARRVTAQAVDPATLTVMCVMENRMDVLGDVLDPFHETVVAVFDREGLVEKLSVYSCRSPIVYVMQRKTGRGPYAEGEMEGARHDELYHIHAGAGGQGEGCCD